MDKSAESRRQKAEGRRQKAEGGRQKAEKIGLVLSAFCRLIAFLAAAFCLPPSAFCL
jgi:hypothetical protein